MGIGQNNAAKILMLIRETTMPQNLIVGDSLAKDLPLCNARVVAFRGLRVKAIFLYAEIPTRTLIIHARTNNIVDRDLTFAARNSAFNVRTFLKYQHTYIIFIIF